MLLNKYWYLLLYLHRGYEVVITYVRLFIIYLYHYIQFKSHDFHYDLPIISYVMRSRMQMDMDIHLGNHLLYHSQNAAR